MIVGLQSYAHVLTSGTEVWLEYKPPTGAQDCVGRDGDSTVVEMEFVLVTPSIPDHIESFRFTKCPALHGYIPTGVLCDQYTEGRPVGCPLNMTQGFDVATGQDRRNLDCYRLALGSDAIKPIRELMDGVLRLAPEVATLPPTSLASKRTSLTAFSLLMIVFSVFRLTPESA